MSQRLHPKAKALLARESIEQKTPRWFEARGKMVTASQAASVIGCCKYKSPEALMREKLTPDRGYTGSFATEWGVRHEDEAIQKYEELTGRRVLPFGLLIHPQHDWLGASPDGLAVGGPEDEPYAVEVKCPVSREIKDEVPDMYYPQVQLQLEIMDLETCVFVQYRPQSMWGDQVLVVTLVQRNRAWFEKYLPVMRDFYDKWMTLKAAGVTYVPRKRAAKEQDLQALPRKPYPFLLPLWLLDRVVCASGGPDEFTQASSWELVRKAALQAAIDAAAAEFIPGADADSA